MAVAFSGVAIWCGLTTTSLDATPSSESDSGSTDPGSSGPLEWNGALSTSREAPARVQQEEIITAKQLMLACD